MSSASRFGPFSVSSARRDTEFQDLTEQSGLTGQLPQGCELLRLDVLEVARGRPARGLLRRS
jgi:hypothetical protein